jgi:hypothetical protein
MVHYMVQYNEHEYLTYAHFVEFGSISHMHGLRIPSNFLTLAILPKSVSYGG